MANVAEKFGLRPYRKLDGTPLVGAQNRYTIKANYGQNIFQGDLVIPVSTGNIERSVYNTSEAVVGVFNGPDPGGAKGLLSSRRLPGFRLLPFAGLSRD